MQQLLSSLEEERQRQFRRFAAISAGVHVMLGVLIWVGPVRTNTKALPVVERVALVPTLPAPPTARSAPAKPAKLAPAEPPPPPPPPAKKVLPKQPAPIAKPKPPEVKAKAQVKPEPKAEPKPPEPAPEQELDDVLAQLRNEKGETAPRPVEQAAAAVGPAGGPGVVDPELARWHRDFRIHVTRAWIVPPAFRTQELVAMIEVDLSGTGEVLGTRIKQSSGDPFFDESVERAIRKASPVPPPPDPGDWVIPFESREPR